MLSLDDTGLVCIGVKYCRRTRNPPSSCLCKKLIFWWERDDDWQPRLLGGLALGRWSLRVLLTCPASCHQSCASPHLIINLWIHLNPTLVQSLFQVFYLNFHQSEASLVPPSRSYNLTSLVLKLWINLNVNFTFNQSASLFQVFYPNIHQSEAVFA